jgi:hypothetical protein
MNKICSVDAIRTLCDRHGSADVCDSEECCSRVKGRNYDVCDSRWHHHLDGNENSGHFWVLIKKLSSRAIGEVEYDCMTVSQWTVVSTNILLTSSTLGNICIVSLILTNKSHAGIKGFKGCRSVERLVGSAAARLLVLNLPYFVKHTLAVSSNGTFPCTHLSVNSATRTRMRRNASMPLPSARY